RTGAYFSTAPFLGAVLAMPLLGDSLGPQVFSGGVLMGLGVWLHLTEHHEHHHEHEAMTHEHRHSHDAHHQHAHGPGDPPGEPHSPGPVHWRVRHAPPPRPDMHHQPSH